MKRRNFLKFASIGAAALAVLPGFSLYYASSRDCAVDLILDEYKFLKIGREEVVKYVDDFYKLHPVEESTPWQMKIKIHHYFNIATVRSEMLVKGFLLSTNFFMNKMDETRPVEYISLYNPYKQPCANPFSFMYYPQQNISS